MRMRRTRGAGKESLRKVGVGGGGVVVGYVAAIMSVVAYHVIDTGILVLMKM